MGHLRYPLLPQEGRGGARLGRTHLWGPSVLHRGIRALVHTQLPSWSLRGFLNLVREQSGRWLAASWRGLGGFQDAGLGLAPRLPPGLRLHIWGEQGLSSCV